MYYSTFVLCEMEENWESELKGGTGGKKINRLRNKVTDAMIIN